VIAYLRKSVRLKIDRTKEEINSKSQEVATFEAQVKDLQQNKMKIQYQSQAKEKLKSDIKDLQAEHSTLDQALSVCLLDLI
jgi:chromosome segregation ATPase